jgi:acyl-CoA thioester hydrolase
LKKGHAVLRFQLPAEKRLVHEQVIPIRWGDMDAFGHVNNTVYFRYMEIMRIDWLQQGLGQLGIDEGPVIVNAFCNFLRQLTFPGDVLARMYVGRVGNTSVDTYVTMALTDAPDTVCAEGGARMVWVRYADQKSVPLPPDLRALMG